MHRIHQDLSRCSTTYETGQIYACFFFDNMFKTLSKLNNHTTDTHQEEFDSVVGLLQISLQINKLVEERLQEKIKVPELRKCQDSEKLCYTNEDIEAHKTKVHEYGE